MIKSARITKLGRLFVEVLNNSNIDTLSKFQLEAQAQAIRNLMDDSSDGNEISMDLAAKHLAEYEAKGNK